MPFRLTTGRMLVAGVLLLSVAAKMFSVDDESFFISGIWRSVVLVLELMLVLLLFTRYSRTGFALSAAFFLLGGVLSLLIGGRSCGCFGSWIELGQGYHLILSGAGGAISLWMWQSQESRSVDPPLPQSTTIQHGP